MSKQSGKQAHHPVDAAKALEVVLHKILEADLLEEVFLPALDATIYAHRHVALLAHHRAETPLFVACGKMLQGIRQVIKFASIKELFRHVVLEPEHLGDFHLNAHGPTNITEQVMVGGIDLLGFFDRAVVQPQNHVVVIPRFIKARSSYGHGFVGVMGKDC